jgi:hypothetical protein
MLGGKYKLVGLIAAAAIASFSTAAVGYYVYDAKISALESQLEHCGADRTGCSVSIDLYDGSALVIDCDERTVDSCDIDRCSSLGSIEDYFLKSN